MAKEEREGEEKTRPAQEQDRQPGIEKEMTPKPAVIPDGYRGSGKLAGKVALITGGDSGIGRAVAVLYAMEGADVAISYLDEHEDAKETKVLVEKQGRKCLLLPGDLGSEAHCKKIVGETVSKLGKLDVLVNNAAEQHDHLREGSSIINCTSVTAYRGSSHLVDYASTKGAIVAFTRSLAQQLVEKKIRVNAVAPGPIWTPLIPASFDEESVEKFGKKAPMGRPGEPAEVAPCFVFLASRDASYFTGQVLHPNGGEIVNA